MCSKRCTVDRLGTSRFPFLHSFCAADEITRSPEPPGEGDDAIKGEHGKGTVLHVRFEVKLLFSLDTFNTRCL